MRERFKGFDWGITTRLVFIPQWLVVIPQQGKFKAPQPINKQCVNTQVNICEEQLGTMDSVLCCVASKAEIQASYITLHLCNNNDIPLVV